MRTIEMIETEMADLKRQLAEARGTETEVYTRIVGYYRSLRNWNLGKREEYNHRLPFAAEEVPAEPRASRPEAVQVRTDAQGSLFAEPPAGEIAGYSYFFRKTCPNCPPVHDFVSALPLEGTQVDVDTEEGLSRAAAFGVMSTPTVVFFDGGGRPVRLSHSVSQMQEFFAR